ncbi:transposase [Sulfobacillus acidophilus TPY]|nr:transposase [Sulfobacillus acidophilus TPY]
MKEESLVTSSITKKPRPEQTLTVPWVDILHDAQDGLLALSVRIGLQVLQQMMAAEVEQLAGPLGRHNPHRQAVRHGTEAGRVYLGDRKIAVTHPRIRATDGSGEIPVETYHQFQDPALATQTVLERMLYGLASRQQVHADAAWEAAAAQPGPSKSTVSRRFIQATQQALDRFLNRRLDDRTWVVLMIDGLRVADHLVVGALGIDAEGHKRVLGLVEGATENHTVVMTLLQDLITRGLTAAQGLLVVIDGAKALAKAVREVWGHQVLIQRGQIHKQRNVLDHLPKSAEHRIRQKLRKAYREPDADTAAQALEAIAKELERDHPGAAGSLREGMEETLTVHRLGLPGLLRQTLANTNAMESLNSQFRTHAQNVKHWTNGQQVLRWLASASFFIEDTLTRIPGYREIPLLQTALKAAVSPQINQKTEEIG